MRFSRLVPLCVAVMPFALLCSAAWRKGCVCREQY